MQCSKCQLENRDGAKFCLQCGNSLESKCPQCSKPLPLQARFCDDCGHELDKPLSAAKPTSPSDSARKYVTVLFSDMSGYTSMSEKMDPEEVKEIMGKIFGEISKVVSRYEGFIEKFIGDAVMALFGVPQSHEDDPVRAIKAAREIHEIVSSISPQYEKRIGKPLAMHTGICTGLVVTGEVNLEKGTHGVLGDTINTAARLSGLAKPGEIVIGPDTYHQAEGYFNFEPLAPATVKGKAEPIHPYKVLSPKEDPSKTHRITGLRSGLIGRNVEMAQLQEAVTNLKQGKGSIFSIVGDAGTGKSRLIEEFRATLNSQEIQWRDGHCYAYAQNIPYFPLINLFYRAWRIEEGDSSEAVRNKVETGIKYLLGNDEGVIPYIGTLYSLNYPEIEGIGPEQWKSRLYAGVQSLLSALTRRGPSVICLEDLHWSDSSSIELLRFILNDFQLPAVFICAYRPPFSLFASHQLTGLSKVYHEIKLQDLSTSEAQTMVESLLKSEAIPSDLRRFIQTKVEGNPFYLEEAINALIESSTLMLDDDSWKLTKQISEAVIPSSIQGIITARLDRLETETKRILQEASVIGRAFFYEILKRITDLKDIVDKSINGLERLDFIRARTLQPDLEYIFKHALTQEVVYNGLLKKERQALHERVGLVMEQLFQDRLPEFYETLAFHFKQGHSILKAVDYLVKAGEKSFKRYALDESHLYYQEAFDLLSNKTEKRKDEEKLIIDLINKWGLIYLYRADYIGFINLFKAHETLAESHADKEQLAMFYGWLGWALSRRDKPQEGYQYLRRALQIAEDIGDVKGVGHSCSQLAYVSADLGMLDEAIIFGERAREIANRFESEQQLFRMAHSGSSYAHWLRGDVKKTAEFAQVLLDYGKRHSNMYCTAYYYHAMGFSTTIAGDISSAIEFYKKTIQHSPDPMLSHAAKMLLGMCYLSTGQVKDAQDTFEGVIEHNKRFGYEWIGGPALALKGLALMAQGNLKEGVALFENVRRTTFESKSLYRYAAGMYLMGRFYSKIAQGGGEKKDFSLLVKNMGFLIKNMPFAFKKAEEYFNEAIKVAKEIGAKSILGQAYLDLGRLHKAKGKTEKARESLSNAIEAFEKCEADVYLKQAKEALATLG